MAAHVVSQIEVPSIQKIDREKVSPFSYFFLSVQICPLLLRIFCSSGRHNSSSDYDRGSTPGNELQVYTWLDCTLRELSSLIKDVNPDARKPGTEYKFAVGLFLLISIGFDSPVCSDSTSEKSSFRPE